VNLEHNNGANGKTDIVSLFDRWQETKSPENLNDLGKAVLEAAKKQSAPYRRTIGQGAKYDIDDIAQEAALRFLLKAKQGGIEDTGTLLGLLRVMVARAAIDFQREETGRVENSKKRRGPTRDDYDFGMVGTDGEYRPTDLADTTKHLKDRLQAILGNQQGRVICAAIDMLPQGYKHKEIAELLGMQSAMFDSILQQTRQKLTHYPEIKSEVTELLENGRHGEGFKRF